MKVSRPSKLDLNQYFTCSRSSVMNFKDLYEMGKEIGKGSNSCVYACRHKYTGHLCAVKVITKSQDERQIKRFYRELKVFKLTQGHPNICQLLNSFQDPLKFYAVFENMEGGSLLHQIMRKSVFTEAEASLVTRDIANALYFLHNIGIAHRDLKPENVLCKFKHSLIPVKLSDFDLASDYELINGEYGPETSDSNNANGAFYFTSQTPELTTPVGSAEFMAPEVVGTYKGQIHHYDKRCDMWSFGVIIYIMLCGYPPFYALGSGSECPNAFSPSDVAVIEQGQDAMVDSESEAMTKNDTFVFINDTNNENVNTNACGDVSNCLSCRDALFTQIQCGKFSFPSPEWDNITGQAKDLILRLLSQDLDARFRADQVLAHIWITGPVPQTQLGTPLVLKRESCASIDKFTENAVAVNRMIEQCYAIHRDILTTPDSLAMGTPENSPPNDYCLEKYMNYGLLHNLPHHENENFEEAQSHNNNTKNNKRDRNVTLVAGSDEDNTISTIVRDIVNDTGKDLPAKNFNDKDLTNNELPVKTVLCDINCNNGSSGKAKTDIKNLPHNTPVKSDFANKEKFELEPDHLSFTGANTIDNKSETQNHLGLSFMLEDLTLDDIDKKTVHEVIQKPHINDINSSGPVHKRPDNNFNVTKVQANSLNIGNNYNIPPLINGNNHFQTIPYPWYPSPHCNVINGSFYYQQPKIANYYVWRGYEPPFSFYHQNNCNFPQQNNQYGGCFSIDPDVFESQLLTNRRSSFDNIGTNSVKDGCGLLEQSNLNCLLKSELSKIVGRDM